MRVALLSRAVFPLHGYGGLERHVAALEKYLRLEGCGVTLYTATPRDLSNPREGTVFVPYRMIPWPQGKGFAVLDRDTNYLAWSARAGWRVLKARHDVVQADAGAGFGYALFAGDGAPPLVLHPHGMEEFEAPPLKRALYSPLRSAIRYAAKRAARVIAPDASMREDVRRHLGVEDGRIALVPNAIDLADIDRIEDGMVPERLRVGPSQRVLLSVGRLESNKGFTHLVRALSIIDTRLPKDVIWVLVGRGPEKDALERQIAGSGLRDRVCLTGAISDDELSALYRRSELVVLPTLYEGSSMVTLEAMAHRKPVVATEVGGIPDKVFPGENGLLVPPGDAAALAAAVMEAIASPERLRDWGLRGRAIVESRFSWAARVKELLRLYETVVRRRGG
jgi:glycosyltransferase involved in cell wall biosynthesis